MDAVAVVHLRVLHVLRHRLAGDGERVAVDLGEEFPHHGGEAAREVEVVQVVRTRRREVREERDVVRRLVEVLPPRLVVTGLVRDRGDVEDEVRGRGDSHVHLDRVADRGGRDDLARRDALAEKVHHALAGAVGDERELARDGAHSGVVRERHAKRLGDHAHGVGGRHRRAAAARAPRMLDEAVVFVGVDLAVLHRADLVLRVDVQHLLAAERAERHVAAGDDHGRDVEARRRHEVSGHDGVARGEHHHAVEEVAVHRDLHLVGDGVARRDLDVLRVLQHHAVADAGRHHLHGIAARVADALLHALGEPLEVDVPRVVLVPGVDDADQRTRLLLGRNAHAAEESAPALARLAELPLASQIQLAIAITAHFCFSFQFSRLKFMLSIEPSHD